MSMSSHMLVDRSYPERQAAQYRRMCCNSVWSQTVSTLSTRHDTSKFSQTMLLQWLQCMLCQHCYFLRKDGILGNVINQFNLRSVDRLSGLLLAWYWQASIHCWVRMPCSLCDGTRAKRKLCVNIKIVAAHAFPPLSDSHWRGAWSVRILKCLPSR